MGTGILFPVCAIPFSILIIFLFFKKGYIKNEETKIYRYLIVSNLIGLILEILCSFASFYYYVCPFLSNFIYKTYLVYLLIWTSLIALYVVRISTNYNEEDTKKYDTTYLKWVLFLTVWIYILPIQLVASEDFAVRYTTGWSVYYAYFISSIFVVYILFNLIKNIKNIFNAKYIPVFVFFVVGCISILIQLFFPQILLLTYVETFICAIMYFTIENPDVKMIEELNLAKEQADRANNAKTEFLSSMSHEIRTPLNAIVGFSDCILEAETLSEAKDNAADIVNASDTLLEIVNGILDISKIEAGKIEIINAKYNAPNTYLELAKLITPKMQEKGLDFTYNIAPDLPNTLLGDPANIRKIVTNLLSNACKYTDRGFVHYEVNCVNSNGVCKLIISVEDSGRGIKKESMEKMFTKFQRLDEDRNTTIEGTGLGLAITKQLTELMGGRILVHTVFGQGSKFTVVVNQKISNDKIIEHKNVKTTLDLTDVKLLVVDDNQLNIKVAKKLFERFNANHVVSCESGFECLDKIKRGEIYDVILLDDMMPKMSGTETLAELKKIPGFRIPVVALTANAISGMREKYLSEGFDDYLAKPIEKNEFIRVMNELLGRSNTEEIEVVSEVNEPVITNQENVRDEIIVPEEKKPLIIPVEDNIEEILGSQVELSSEHEVIEPKIEEIKVDQIEMLDVEEPVRDEIVIPNLVPVVDIDLEAINSSVTVESTKVEVFDRAYLESNGVDVNHALELLGDMEMYNMTINDFMKEIDEKWNRIISCRDSKDMPNYAIDVHSLKSDCKYLGFMTLADISYQHELKSKENDVEFVLNNFAQLEEEYHKMYEIAKNYAEHNEVEE